MASREDLYLRGRIWWYRIVHPVTKKVMRESTGTDNREWAQKYVDKLKAQLWDEKTGGRKQHTWEAAAAKWIEEKQKQKKADLPGDKQKIEWFNQYFAGKLLPELTRDFVNSILAIKAAEPGRRAGTTKEGSTANRYLAVVRGIMIGAAERWNMLDRNDLPHYQGWKENEGRERYLTYEEANRFLRELPLHLRLVARFCLSTGLRRENILSLKWKQVVFETATARMTGAQMKNKRGLAIPLNEDAMRVLIAAAANANNDEPYVFTYKGHRLHECCTKAWYKAMRRAGLAGVRFHDLRHTWASWLRQLGVMLSTIMELGGWKRMDMVMRYAHIAPDIHAREAASVLDGILALPETPEAAYDAEHDGEADAEDLALEALPA